jgi:hypothetical protein
MGDRHLGSHVQLLTLDYQRRKRERTPRKSRIFTKVQVYLKCVGYFYEAVSVPNASSMWECYVKLSTRVGLELNTGEINYALS